jgi:hypothetical protein
MVAEPIAKEVLDGASVEGLERQPGVVGPHEPRLSEATAYAVLTSQAFARLLARAVRLFPSYELPRDASVWMARAINGLVVDPRRPWLQHLLSGPFDADKRDYVSRDAHECGVPVLAETTGCRSAQQLAEVREFLFAKLYRTHSMRAAEAMAASLLHELASLTSRSPAILAMELDDRALLNPRPWITATMAAGAAEPGRLRCAEALEDVARRRRERNFFVPVAVFPPGSIDVGRQLPELARATATTLTSTTAADLRPYLWFDLPQRPGEDTVLFTTVELAPHVRAAAMRFRRASVQALVAKSA